MMKRILLTQSSIGSVSSSTESVYFIISEPISLKAGETLSFKQGCVLDFRGGYFFCAQKDATASINLNGSDVTSSATCIFFAGVSVRGFSNPVIHAEWFNDATHSMPEHISINRALIAANGTPVTLEHRDYRLSGTISFPEIKDSQFNTQTLISPGTLIVTGDFPAIDITTHSIVLQINSVRGTIVNNEGEFRYKGSGIRFSSNAYQHKIEVADIRYVHRGLDFTPVLSTLNYAGVQYAQIHFGNIVADYCMYVDIYSDDGIWFSESLITGGKMSGSYGIFYADPPAGQGVRERMNGMVYGDICFENISRLPVRIFDLSSSKFFNLRTAGTMPDKVEVEKDGKIYSVDAPWFVFKDSGYITMTFNGMVNTHRFQAEGSVKHIKVTGDLANQDGTYYQNLDTLVFMPLYLKSTYSTKIIDGKETIVRTDENTPSMIATSSVMPSDFCKNIHADATGTPTKFAESEIALCSLLPVYNNTDNDKSCGYTILPLTLNVVIEKYNRLTIDLTGLSRFSQCIINVCVSFPSGVGKLKFKTSGNPSQIIAVSDEVSSPASSFESGMAGLYQLSMNTDSQIVISKVNP